jgi:hypothetical protein
MMPKFTIQVRAIRHLTAELSVEAETEEAARKAAQSRIGSIDMMWDESDPEDEQIETIEEDE